MRLFEHQSKQDAPLAERMRPQRLSEIVGQSHLLGPDRLLARAIRADRLPSVILWGPPGTGKTTIARVLASESSARFVPFSAVLGGVPELRKHIASAREQRSLYGKKTLLFVDEIHRFNKAQQDALLPHVEDGSVVLVGATTENPSFAVNAALRSRAQTFRLNELTPSDVVFILQRACEEPHRGLGHLEFELTDEDLESIARGSRGDARRALEVLELVALDLVQRGSVSSAESIQQAFENIPLDHDRAGENHYNVVSAFIKSMRGNDPDGAIYWMMRMIDGGEDPRFIGRRMLIFAAEDIGNADPRALQLAVAADQSFQRLGLPEGIYPLAQCCLYLASAPKSNACNIAWHEARDDVQKRGSLPVPMKLRNAPNRDMREWGYGEGYRYPHAEGGHAAGETYLPDDLIGRRYYRPIESGLESKIRSRLARLRQEDLPPDPASVATPTTPDAAEDNA